MAPSLRFVAFISSALGIALLSACGDDGDSGPQSPGAASGPINGSWVLEDAQCNDVSIVTQVPLTTIEISNGRFETEIPITEDCSATLVSRAAYEGSRVTVTDETFTCNPSDCAQVCSDAPDNETSTIDFTLAEDRLTFSQIAEGGEDFCEDLERQELIFRRAE